MNTMRLPSGVNRGVFSLLSPPISCLGGVEPSEGTIQMSGFLRPLSRAVVVRVNKTCLPSGEICGSFTRTVVIKSSTVIVRLVWAYEVRNASMREKKNDKTNLRGMQFLLTSTAAPAEASIYSSAQILPQSADNHCRAKSKLKRETLHENHRIRHFD